MEPRLAKPEQPASAAPSEPVRRVARPSFNPLSDARGALVTIIISGGLILGLWLIARDAPSAQQDPRLAPTATVSPGSAPFGNQTYVTVVPWPQTPSPGTFTVPGADR